MWSFHLTLNTTLGNEGAWVFFCVLLGVSGEFPRSDGLGARGAAPLAPPGHTPPPAATDHGRTVRRGRAQASLAKSLRVSARSRGAQFLLLSPPLEVFLQVDEQSQGICHPRGQRSDHSIRGGEEGGRGFDDLGVEPRLTLTQSTRPVTWRPSRPPRPALPAGFPQSSGPRAEDSLDQPSLPGAFCSGGLRRS